MYRILLILFIPAIQFGQMLISPYIVYMDDKNQFGSFIVQNESNEIYEISISFKFGYPISDSLGNASMTYVDIPDDSLPSINNWIRAFPRKFYLQPQQRQVIRMTIRPNRELSPGTYWTRIFTTSSPQTAEIDTLEGGITTNIKFVLNQVTTAVYRVEPANTGADIRNIYYSIDSSYVNIYADLRRQGNSPFLGEAVVTLFDVIGNKVNERTEHLSLYFDLVKHFTFDLDSLNPGSYKAEIKIISDENRDIPESKLKPIDPVIKTIKFDIPY